MAERSSSSHRKKRTTHFDDSIGWTNLGQGKGTAPRGSRQGLGPDRDSVDAQSEMNKLGVLIGQHRLAKSTVRVPPSNDFLSDYVEEASALTSRAALALLSKEQLEVIEQEWRKTATGIDDKFQAMIYKHKHRFEPEVLDLTIDQFITLLSPHLIDSGSFDEQGIRTRRSKRQWRHSSRAGRPTGDEGTMISEEKSISAIAGSKLEADERKVMRARREAGASDLSLYLTDLFASMDPKHTLKVSWETFITYMIEFVFNHKLGTEDGGATLSALAASHLRMDTSTGSAGSMQYRGDITLREPVMTQHWVQRCEYYPEWEAVVGASHQTLNVTLCDDIDKIDLHGSQRVVTKYIQHDGVINAFEYLHSQHLLVTAAAETHQLRLFHVHMGKDLKLIKHCSLDTPHGNVITCMKASERLLMQSDRIKLLVGTRSGHVMTLQMSNSDNIRRSQKSDGSFSRSGVPLLSTDRFHNDAVTDLLMLPRSGRVLSCSINGEIRSHALISGAENTRVEYGGHRRGAYTMAYCSGYEIFVTGGFEYDAFCWAENLPSSPAFALRDTVSPHMCPLLRVIAVDNTPQIYSVDVSGMVKLFDIRTLKVLGSWRAFDRTRVPEVVANDVSSAGERETTHLGSIGSVCYTGPHHRCLMFGSKRYFKFQTETRNPDADRAHDMTETLVSVDVGNKHLLTGTRSTVRLWSQSSGRYVASHRTSRYAASPVRHVVLNDPSGTIITGHGDGKICVFSAEAGVLLRRYNAHTSRITALAVDTKNGLILSAGRNGEFFVWLDRDCVRNGTRMDDHLRNIYGNGMDIPASYRRYPPELPDEIKSVFTHSVSAAARAMRLAYWVLHRWRRLYQRRKDKKKKKKVTEDSIVVRYPNSVMFLRFPVSSITLAPDHLVCCALSTRATVRLIDYSTSPAIATHRLYHGSDRRLLAATYHPESNRVITTDIHGLLYLWLALPSRPAVLLSSWLNKCLVMKYSHPSDMFAEGASDEESAGEEEEEEEKSRRKLDADDDEEMYTETLLMLNESDQECSGEGPRAPVAVPLVVSLHYDPIRQYLISGDDVGYVSFWELETSLLGVADWRDAVKHSKPMGRAPRWVYAWKAYPQSVVSLNTMPHSMYCVVTSSQDNHVTLWAVNGGWIGSLRQGPIVSRTWDFPDLQRAKSVLHVLRLRKVRSLVQSGELFEYCAYRDDHPGEETPLMPAICEGLKEKLMRLATRHVDQSTLKRDWSFIDPMSRILNDTKHKRFSLFPHASKISSMLKKKPSNTGSVLSTVGSGSDDTSGSPVLLRSSLSSRGGNPVRFVGELSPVRSSSRANLREMSTGSPLSRTQSVLSSSDIFSQEFCPSSAAASFSSKDAEPRSSPIVEPQPDEEYRVWKTKLVPTDALNPKDEGHVDYASEAIASLKKPLLGSQRKPKPKVSIMPEERLAEKAARQYEDALQLADDTIMTPELRDELAKDRQSLFDDRREMIHTLEKESQGQLLLADLRISSDKPLPKRTARERAKERQRLGLQDLITTKTKLRKGSSLPPPQYRPDPSTQAPCVTGTVSLGGADGDEEVQLKMLLGFKEIEEKQQGPSSSDPERPTSTATDRMSSTPEQRYLNLTAPADMKQRPGQRASTPQTFTPVTSEVLAPNASVDPRQMLQKKTVSECLGGREGRRVSTGTGRAHTPGIAHLTPSSTSLTRASTPQHPPGGGTLRTRAGSTPASLVRARRGGGQLPLVTNQHGEPLSSPASTGETTGSFVRLSTPTGGGGMDPLPSLRTQGRKTEGTRAVGPTSQYIPSKGANDEGGQRWGWDKDRVEVLSYRNPSIPLAREIPSVPRDNENGGRWTNSDCGDQHGGLLLRGSNRPVSTPMGRLS